MSVVNSDQRKHLERVVGDARDAAETAARAALKRLAVDQNDPFSTMAQEDRVLRNLLRAESRRLGSFEALVTEVAYQHWHRILFARFLAENELLMFEGTNTAVTLADCADIAAEIGEPDAWAVACRYAAAMLPGVFRTGDPVLQVRFATEGRLELEKLLGSLHTPIFKADDSLGWVYQFWQAKAKAEVNASGRKVGGADISPVTQLFTEHYMVQFLLHNSLGAWWVGKHPDEPLPTDMDYLRRLEDGSPAAGTFTGWPATAKELKILDPSCGSGHFLVAAFSLMVRFRMAEESMSESDAGDAVLRDNLFGLELDPRCTQIAAFALALTAWKHGGYRELPLPNVACSGIRLGGTAEDWRKLAGKDGPMQAVLAQVRELFAQAPDLGSLLNPNSIGHALAPRARAATPLASASGTGLQMGLLPSATPTLWEGAGENDDDWTSNGRMSPLVAMERLLPKLEEAAERFGEDEGDVPIFGEAAKEAVRAVRLLAQRYHLVVTNVPYLGLRKMGDNLKRFSISNYNAEKSDLATVFVRRCFEFCASGATVALVVPQAWLFQTSSMVMREGLLRNKIWNCVARLGPGAFETISGEVVNIGLFIMTNTLPISNHIVAGFDVSLLNSVFLKQKYLRDGILLKVNQLEQLDNPESRFAFEQSRNELPLLEMYAIAPQGIKTGDDNRWSRMFWEVPSFEERWAPFQSATSSTAPYTARERIIDWSTGGQGLIRARLDSPVLGQKGVVVSGTGGLAVTIYTGDRFDSSANPVVPKDPKHLSAIWAFCESKKFIEAVRRIDQKLIVTNQTLLKVPFDISHWQKVASAKYPHGLPEPHSDDPTQWLFDGHPARAAGQPGDLLHVAVARLLGYRWPRQTGTEIPGCHLLPDDGLDVYSDTDGIVCLPTLSAELSAAQRLRTLIAGAYSAQGMKNNTEAQASIDRLLAEIGYGGKTLEDWLQNDFFAQHARRFHNRPFLWHIWDGVKEGGFSAIVNYHKFDRAKLEKLIYSYLVGDWIKRQTDADKEGVPGANERLVKALALQRKLEAILEGEPPYDIYVRWKSRAEQPLGWEPDLSDGVRMNIRPFVVAGILRSKFTINWNKDRGVNSDGSDRHNDQHLTLSEKRAARAHKISSHPHASGEAEVNVAQKVRERIQESTPGAVFVARDFLDLGSRDAIQAELQRLETGGILRHLKQGIYHFPRISKILGEPVPPRPEEIAAAIARRSGSEIAPFDAEVANLLGLTTQVQGRNIYLINRGKTRTVYIGHQTIELRSTSDQEFPRNFGGEILRALLYVGESDITPEVLKRLRESLAPEQKIELRQESESAPSWLKALIARVADLEEKG